MDNAFDGWFAIVDFTPRPPDRLGHGVRHATEQPDWVTELLNAPFRVEITDAGVVFHGDGAAITFGQPEGTPPNS